MRRPRDIEPARALETRSATEPHGSPAVAERRVLAHVTSNALALDADHVYFGDEATRALYRAPKRGGRRIAVGVPSPLAIALAPESIVWIATPGNLVLRAPRDGGPATIVRDRGAFTAIATLDGDVFVGESTPPGGGTLTRVAGPTARRIAVLDAAPRAMVTDGAHVWVQTSRDILRVAPTSGEVQSVLHAAGVSRLAVDADSIYTTEPDGASRTLVRVDKSGASRSVLARGVRDAPILVHDGWVYYLEADEQPTLLRAARAGGASAFVARDEALRHVLAMVIDASGVFVASDRLRGGEIVEMPMITLPPPESTR